MDFWYETSIDAATPTAANGLLLLRSTFLLPQDFVEVSATGSRKVAAELSGAKIALPTLLLRPSGGYLLVALFYNQTSSPMVVALSPSLQVEWIRSVSLELIPGKMAATSDGGLVLTSKQPGGFPIVCRLDACGNVKWATAYQSDAFPQSVVETNDGGVGVAFYGFGSTQLEVLKLDAQGQKLFSKTLLVGTYPLASLGATASGLLVAATSSNGLVTCGLDSLGAVTSSQVYAGWKGSEHKMTKLPSGGFLLAGGVFGFGWAKLSEAGLLSQSRTMPEADSYFEAFSPTADGGFLMQARHGILGVNHHFTTRFAADWTSCVTSQLDNTLTGAGFSVVTTNAGGVAPACVTSIAASGLSTVPPTSQSLGNVICP